MDCQGLVARLVLDFVLLTTAVEVASRWRELAEKLARVSRQQMEAYEAPHRDKNGLLDNEVTTAALLTPTTARRGTFSSSCSHLNTSLCSPPSLVHVETSLRLPADLGRPHRRQLPRCHPRASRGPRQDEKPHHQEVEAPDGHLDPGQLPR